MDNYGSLGWFTLHQEVFLRFLTFAPRGHAGLADSQFPWTAVPREPSTLQFLPWSTGQGSTWTPSILSTRRSITGTFTHAALCDHATFPTVLRRCNVLPQAQYLNWTTTLSESLFWTINCCFEGSLLTKSFFMNVRGVTDWPWREDCQELVPPRRHPHRALLRPQTRSHRRRWRWVNFLTRSKIIFGRKWRFSETATKLFASFNSFLPCFLHWERSFWRGRIIPCLQELSFH